MTMMDDVTDLIRLLAAMLAVVWLWGTGSGWVRFARSSYWAAGISWLLGVVGLLLPGAFLAACVVLRILVRSSGSRLRPGGTLRVALVLLGSPERGRRWMRGRFRLFARDWSDLLDRGGQQTVCLVMFAVVAITLATGNGRVPERFFSADGYQRSMELQLASHNAGEAPGGSAALLAAVAFLSGLDGAYVIRYSNVVFSVILGMLAFTMANRKELPMGVCWLVAGLTPLASLFLHGEAQESTIAAVYIFVSWVIWRDFPLDALAAFALAVAIHPRWAMEDVASLAVLAGAMAAGRLFAAVPQRLGVALATGAVFSVSIWLGGRVPDDGPYQYEAAARLVRQVQRDYGRNTWLIISPVQEVAMTYGMGWHMELSDFVNTYSEQQVSKASFRFPFPVERVFLFVEKQPLSTPEVRLRLSALSETAESSTASYHLRTGRASLQFRAARLMAAYSLHHSTTVFYEDQNLVVYRL